jgi:hypothetical protein
MLMDGGEETQVLDQPPVGDWFNSKSTFSMRVCKSNGRIEFFAFATHETTAIFSLKKPAQGYGGQIILSPADRASEAPFSFSGPPR